LTLEDTTPTSTLDTFVEDLTYSHDATNV